MKQNSEKWMKDLPDYLLLSLINIPASHESCSLLNPSYGFMHSKCQNISLSQQFSIGIRAIDIKVRRRGGSNSLFAYHGTIYQKDLKSILATCTDFLTQNPTETVLLFLKEEDDGEPIGVTSHHGISIFTPELNYKCPSYEECFIHDTEPFRHMFYRYGENIHNIPTLGDLRSKILFFRESGADKLGGIKLQNMNEKKVHGYYGIHYCVQDHLDSTPKSKLLAAKEFLTDAAAGPENCFYLNFLSFSKPLKLKPEEAANEVLPQFQQSLLGLEKEYTRYGILFMDFCDKAKEIIILLYNSNKFLKSLPIQESFQKHETSFQVSEPQNQKIHHESKYILDCTFEEGRYIKYKGNNSIFDTFKDNVTISDPQSFLSWAKRDQKKYFHGNSQHHFWIYTDKTHILQGHNIYEWYQEDVPCNNCIFKGGDSKILEYQCLGHVYKEFQNAQSKEIQELSDVKYSISLKVNDYDPRKPE